MQQIESFRIDHTRLKRGIYVARQDVVGGKVVTTFDLRVKEPNNEPPLDSATVHTMEHIGATFLRHHPGFGSKVLYFGPMGCLTGFYLLIKGKYQSKEILPLIRELFLHVAGFEGAVPGATRVECGNHRLMDPPSSKLEARRYYKEVLEGIDDEHLMYPV